MRLKVVFINNMDSFVYNLVDYVVRVSDSKVIVVDNSITLDGIEEIAPNRIVVSPGPGHPRDAGNVIPIIQNFYLEIPILGVCLGNQAVYEAFGGRVERMESGPVHGKASYIYHDGEGIFRGVANPFLGARYHSLEAKTNIIPRCLKMTARTRDGAVMGIRHVSARVDGVQFHPESIITQHGLRILKNFIYQKS
jgi:para-aminobenzoate synthetase component 2